ncbi:Pentatricopeptide repeat-containing protein [Dichanthelium oligosanthes]|uniref:Pentatricopeptide repeat-containing protein n=1 Tax=Dichanthelium oligosanthes TaxID=888268 RepID=A0A1E5V5A8_9POAL|nr:Pentatricopeptide repeat-containing protein [Dichanthelium oligosanthes]
MDYSTLLHFTAFCPDYRTYALLLRACARCSDLYAAMEIHCHLTKVGLLSNQHITPPLLKLYIAHDCMLEARELFWSILESSTDPFHGNLMLMGFLKSGQLDKAYQIFKRMPVKDLVSWNSMIAGAVRSSHLKDAMNLFSRLVSSGLVPDGFSFSSVLSACARAGARRYGVWVHQLMTELGVEMNHILSSALVNMYAKCGRIDVATDIFNTVKRNHISVWNTMISGLAAHGLGSDVVILFRKMKSEEVVPDGVTFVALLTACSHCGMVEEARQYFKSMTTDYSITPEVEHYGALVDSLSRAGLLDEAHNLVRSMSVKPDAVIWRALLSACRRYHQTKLGELTVEHMACHGSGDYTLLSNIYSSANRWNDSEELWKQRKQKKIRKSKGLSWVELGGSTHEFKAGDQSHPDTEGIYQVLHGLSKRAKVEGYAPLTELVTKDVSEEEREENLTFHSEKLAVAYSVLKTGPGTEIMVSKNLQTCSDCHEWMKIVSKVLCRVIIMRDRIRFHRFESGCCSCKDYWIIEFAVRDLMGGKKSTFQTLINPEKEVRNTYVHGISNSMLCRPDVPRFGELIPILLQYVSSRQMDGKPVLWVAHNGRSFDVPFLIFEFRRCKAEMPGDWLFVDTLPIARQLVDSSGSKLSSASLEKLRERYKIPLTGSAHRAMQDVTTLCYVLQKLTFELKLTVPQLLEKSFRASDLPATRPEK